MVMDGSQPIPESEIVPKQESRFGDVEKIIEAMSSGEIIRLGSIDEVCEDVPEHANKVDVMSVDHKNVNEVLGVEIQKGQDKLLCIFKPASGENSDIRRKTMVDKFYPRECAAYLISDSFGLDVVPPTVIREINGEIGSLQLYLDHDYYQNFSKLMFADIPDGEADPTDIAESGKDWQSIALLDWILANCERHEDNMMVRSGDPKTLAAIDHGIIMSPPNYAEMSLRGPSLHLTYNGREETPKQIDIPEELIALVEGAYAKKDELTAKLEALNNFDKQEIISFWMRVEAVLKYKKFLSKMNYSAVAGVSWLGAEYRGEV